MINIKGQKFGRLTPVDYMGKSLWRCACDCGKTCYVLSYSIIHGRTKSCGCLQKETAKNLNLKKPGEACFTAIYLSYVHGAKGRDLDFNLSRDFVRNIISQPCHYCGIAPGATKYLASKNGYYTYNGIDRIDSRFGYIEENVVPCCKRCNFAKSTFDANSFLEWAKAIYLHNFES